MKFRPLAIALASLPVLLAGRAHAAPAMAGNSVFQVGVESQPGSAGVGVFSISTGPAHPSGSGRDVLYGSPAGEQPPTSYLTVRSYTTGTDYVQAASASSGNRVFPLDSFGAVTPIAGNGFETSYDLTAPGAAPEALQIRAHIEVSGQDIEDSQVKLSAAVTNAGAFPVSIGFRYLLDFSLAGDDGPQLDIPGAGDTRLREETLTPAPSAAVITGNGPGGEEMSMTTRPVDGPAADSLAFASWPHAAPFAFDYTTADRDIAGRCGLNDSALIYYFGSAETTAFQLDPGQTARVALALSATQEPPQSQVGPASCQTAPTPQPTGAPTPMPATASPAPSVSAGPQPSLPVVTPAALPRTGAQSAPLPRGR